ncbi:flagellar biosynthesis repressor FlbT [Pleomorphomonas sp. PLEO]|uniref:flagellar biosynthesis repressor FlbT n=1 Tax=Pleomorphomonas sp. PLEO TaxID=3239306 RepID=UPI00351EA5CF
MSNGSMHIGLRARERLYINGAVIRVDRKVSIELLNDVSFLLEAHVMQPEETTTPLRQLYFAVQMIMIDGTDSRSARSVAAGLITSLDRTLINPDIRVGLRAVEAQLAAERPFDALKTIRSLFPVEAGVLGGLIAA